MKATMTQRVGMIVWAAALVGLLIFGIFSTGLASAVSTPSKAHSHEQAGGWTDVDFDQTGLTQIGASEADTI